ncbi:hypothetical protein A9306_00120 [Moraxella atlantae]|uniref:CAAX prenyl protease 2/Lysostaphin resistance protein A-like domain-containing protein n=2 Tax=Faucicola atlantae TaxID=34059 RepID=A0A1B8QLP0_9GAMM|nr:hypothetical protein A9306_00120 [Moraxella atlantae]
MPNRQSALSHAMPRQTLAKTLAVCMAVLLVFFVTQLVTTTWLAGWLLPVSADDWHVELASGAQNGTVIAASVLLTLPILAAVLAIFCWWRGDKVPDGLALHATSTRQAFGWRRWLSFAVLLFALNIVLECIGRWLQREPMAFMDDLVVSAQPFWWLVVAMVIAAPIYEELMFRGFMWTALAQSTVKGRKLGAWGASIITSVIFALIHLQYGAVEMLGIVALGMLFAVARAKTGALYLPITLHIANNAMAMAQYIWGY